MLFKILDENSYDENDQIQENIEKWRIAVKNSEISGNQDYSTNKMKDFAVNEIQNTFQCHFSFKII